MNWTILPSGVQTALLTVALAVLLGGCGEGDTPKEALPSSGTQSKPSEDGALSKEESAGLEAQLIRIIEKAPESQWRKHRINASSGAFDAILGLRSVGTKKAVPVLHNVLASNYSKSNIFGFASAQALYIIDTAEAHQLLAKYLLTNRYSVTSGIDYTYGWKMAEPARSRFIERYHLTNLSDDLQLIVSAREELKNGKQNIAFTVTLRNASAKAFSIVDRKPYTGSMLILRSLTGRFAHTFYTVAYNLGMPQWLVLKPGESHKYKIVTQVRHTRELSPRYPDLSKDATLVLDTSDVAYDIIRAGQFEVYAMLEARPQTKAQLKFSGIKDAWSGRSVSKPIGISIK